MRRAITFVLCTSSLLAASPAGAAWLSADDLKLVDASGVPAEVEHRYTFQGAVQLMVSNPGSSPAHVPEKTFWTEGHGNWNEAKKEAREKFRFSGDLAGDLAATFKCPKDPWLYKGGSCVFVGAQFAGSGALDWSALLKKHGRPLSSAAADLAYATKLSQAHGPTKTAAVPPPKASVPPPKKTGPVELPLLALPANPTADRPVVTNLPPLPVKPTMLPDLAGSAQLRIAGKHTAAWGSAVALTDADARTVKDGVCQIAFEHDVRNVGQAPIAATSRRWTNQNHPMAFAADTPALAPGQSVRRVDTLPLRPGPNVLVLGLDEQNQVKEGSERNNVYTVTVNLNGSCGGGLPMQARSGAGGLRWAPQGGRFELPAVQQPSGSVRSTQQR